jgi:hypothetical protein
VREPLAGIPPFARQVAAYLFSSLKKSCKTAELLLKYILSAALFSFGGLALSESRSSFCSEKMSLGELALLKSPRTETFKLQICLT